MTDPTKQLIVDLEDEYDQVDGFLGLLRGGHFDTRARDRFLRLLQSINLGKNQAVDRRLVSLLWYMPLFVEWQQRRFDGEERRELQNVLNEVTNQLERILGVP